MVAATACTTPIPTASLSTLFVDALLVAIMGLGIPTLMAAFAGSGIHLALEHLAAARVASSQQQTQLSSPPVNSFGVQSTHALNGGARPTSKI